MNIREAYKLSENTSDKWDPYLDVYEKHLNHYRDHNRTPVVVEVGVQGGGSLSMWSKYFPVANIFGIDIDPKCAELVYTDKNIQVIIGDQGDPAFWDDVLKNKIGTQGIDIFIDDGGHFVDAQILTFQKVWPYMNPQSTYICEDTHTSYMAYNGGGLNRKGTFIEYAKKFADVLHYEFKEETTSELEVMKALVGDTLRSVSFYNSMVVFEKDLPVEMKRISNV
jgi:cephalosporin hydroxylase